MKIQCACGTKYAFDVTPEMVRSPIQFVCQNCGQDNSAVINQLIRQQFAPEASAPAVVAPPPEIAPPPAHRSITPMPIAATAASAPVAPPVSGSGLRVSGANHAAASAAAPPVDAPQICMRHAGQVTTHRCMVCQKPMCPKCMESFGFVCSAYCKGKAETQGLHVPTYSGQRVVAQSRQFRKMGTIITAVIVGFALVMGGWGWYAWVGSIPRVTFSARFSEAGHSGELVVGQNGDAVFLHGGRLVRHDIKEGKELWSTQLLDKKKIAEVAAADLERMQKARQKAIEAGAEFDDALPSLAEIIADMERSAAAAMHLQTSGDSLWVSSPEKVLRFDRQTGKSTQEIPLTKNYRRLALKGEELILEAPESVMRLNLASGETRVEEAKGEEKAGSKVMALAKPPGGNTASARLNDPARAQNLPSPGRAALPAVRAVSANQDRLKEEMRGAPTVAPASVTLPSYSPPQFTLTKDGAFQLTTTAVGTDARTHRVTLRQAGGGSGDEWTGQMPDAPELHSLKTVHVLAAGRQMLVLDKNLKKLWEARLEDPLRSPSQPEFIRPERNLGQGPCAEDGGSLYLFNSKMLAAYDLANGSLRWRESIAETTELFFDDQGAIYANGITTGGDKAQPMVTKVDAKTGKVLWNVPREGAVTYVSGKLVYTVESYVGDDDEADGILGSATIFHVPAYMRIRRLDASNGRVLWHHHQERCPLDIQFDRTTIHLLFRKELVTLKFLML